VRADDDHHPRSADHEALHPREGAAQRARLTEREVRELLRQAGVHVVQVRDAEHARDQHADEAAFFVRVHGVVPIGERTPQGREREREIERDFRERRSNPDLVDEGRAQTPEHPEARQRDVPAEWIRHEIDCMAELEQRTDAMVLAERRAPGLEERLRRDHQDFHDLVLGIVGNAPGKVNVTLAVCMGYRRGARTGTIGRRGPAC
jgi:hypothetical protein